MKQLLLITASPRGDQSVSRRLASQLVERLTTVDEPLELVNRDLTSTALPHLDQNLVNAYFTPEAKRSDQQREFLAVSDRLVDEVIAADIVVIAAPVWNLGIPASLKAWIDLVSRAGRTFAYTPQGPVGLVQSKPVYVVKSSGGVFTEGPLQALDFYEGYLKAALGFLGLKNVTFVRAEGLNLPGQAEMRLQAAINQIDMALMPSAAVR
jgi:FMN-dependent NADH-azoreductase